MLLYKAQKNVKMPPRPGRGGLSFFVIFRYIFSYARLAQLVEHSTDTRKVLGSIPRARTRSKKQNFLLFRTLVRAGAMFRQ